MSRKLVCHAYLKKISAPGWKTLHILFHDVKLIILWTLKRKAKKIFMYIKMHYGETSLGKIWKLEKAMIENSLYGNHVPFSFSCHRNKFLLGDLRVKSSTKTEWSKTILQHTRKLLLQKRIYINHAIHHRFKNSTEHLKGKILESIYNPWGVFCRRKY